MLIRQIYHSKNHFTYRAIMGSTASAKSNPEMTACSALIKKFKQDPASVQWQEFLDIADRMEKASLFCYRQLETFRFQRAVAKMPSVKRKQDEADTALNVTKQFPPELQAALLQYAHGSDVPEDVAFYRERMWSDMQTYLAPTLTPDERKELQSMNKMEITPKDPTGAQVSMLELQYQIHSNDFFLQMIRSSTTVAEFVTKYDEANKSKNQHMRESSVMLLLDLEKIDQSTWSYWIEGW
jgi:hypothetical protein